MEETAPKYKKGDIVYAKENPNEKLVVSQYLRRVYHCKFVDHPDRKEVALFDRELVNTTSTTQ